MESNTYSPEGIGTWIQRIANDGRVRDFILSFFAGLYARIAYFCGKTIQGWTIILLSIWFLGGTQLLCIGILGEYIGKNYLEVKR